MVKATYCFGRSESGILLKFEKEILTIIVASLANCEGYLTSRKGVWHCLIELCGCGQSMWLQ